MTLDVNYVMLMLIVLTMIVRFTIVRNYYDYTYMYIYIYGYILYIYIYPYSTICCYLYMFTNNLIENSLRLV